LKGIEKEKSVYDHLSLRGMRKISGKICEIGYVNKIRDNIFDMKKDSLVPLYEALRSADCVVCGGSGRSLYSLNAAMSQIATMKDSKVVITPDDPGFPGKDMYDAAGELEKRYENILLLINSGSGESKDPKALAEELARYIEDTGSASFTMGLITSHAASSIADIVRKYGKVIDIKGRAKEERPTEEYSETGIMGDIFELESLFVLHMLTEVFFRNSTVEEGFELFEDEFRVLGEMIDSNVGSEAYDSLIDIMERRSDVFLGGKGTADEVVKMTVIRLAHIKKFLGDNVYTVRGVNTPRPRAGDLEILVSYSGETKSVINWCNIFRDLKGIAFSVTGTKDSPLDRNSDYKIILEENVRPGQPRRFYMRAAFVLSPLPVKLVERLREKGLILPEYIIDWYHSLFG
jgi:D-arabinose 5-phosphate isomerase GutQ